MCDTCVCVFVACDARPRLLNSLACVIAMRMYVVGPHGTFGCSSDTMSYPQRSGTRPKSTLMICRKTHVRNTSVNNVHPQMSPRLHHLMRPLHQHTQQQRMAKQLHQQVNQSTHQHRVQTVAHRVAHRFAHGERNTKPQLVAQFTALAGNYK